MLICETCLAGSPDNSRSDTLKISCHYQTSIEFPYSSISTKTSSAERMGFIGPLLWDLHYKKVVKHFACGNICAYACLVVVVAEERILYAVYADVIDSSKKGDSKFYGRHIYI
ncbi:uncharacterized protein LOC131804714 isoform X2 [Musca domestica]|uniref:Uncharacterized protein LOC131804714 isoform X2 n=1 Tax=Musca domestica TaxID=7370 RepID=A0ABM3VDD3_MUSDO|nr:uncharacterized protein LOC131804714 isoform X2 [Musca domestica]